MPFQPFGYPFSVQSPLPPTELKAAIRARRKSWFDIKTGPRGWIAGPLICLWLSAFDRQGPMLFGWIGDNGLGSRISGRAGSDLNGIVGFALAITLVAFAVYKGGVDHWSVHNLTIALFFGATVPLIFWFAHKDRKQAAPLIRFLEDVATPLARRGQSTQSAPSRSLAILVNGEPQQDASAHLLHEALLSLAQDEFVILEEGPQDYLQTRFDNDTFVIEKQTGGLESHFMAVRREGASGELARDRFLFDEMYSLFMAYWVGKPEPSFVRWERMSLRG